MRAAVQAVLLHDPARVVAAAPVGTREACGALLGEADDVVCPYLPEPFHAVGRFYIAFDPVRDADVEAALADYRAGRWASQPPRGGIRRPGAHVPAS
jgi:predicted phosphoribosyltransferase